MECLDIWGSCDLYLLDSSLELCLTLCNPLDCSPPVSSVHGILCIVRILGGLPFSSVQVQTFPNLERIEPKVSIAGTLLTFDT